MIKPQENKQSRIGDEVEAYCGRCRMERNHKVVAQDPDGTIRKVICGMCNSYRIYRPPKQNETRTGKPRASRASSPRVEDFGPPSRNYSMRENYLVGDVIAHPTFGVGKVITLKDSNKIEVKFSDGLKVLLQNK
jgi:hypothetical protein